MKFLVDNAISPFVSDGLRKNGYDSVHVRETGMHSAPDNEIFGLALRENRVIISSDADFGALLAISEARKSSVIFFRSGADKKPDRQLKLLIDNLASIHDSLEEGSLVVFEPSHLRVRKLPILGE